MKWTNEDIKLVEKFIDIKDRGYYVEGYELTQVYNRVLEKNVQPTNCGSCLRQRINELQVALQQFKKSIEVNSEASEDGNPMEAQNNVSEASEGITEDKVDNTKEEDKKPLKKENKKVVDGNQHRPKEVKK